MRRRPLTTLVLNVAGALWLGASLFPFYWLLMLSLKTRLQAFAHPPLLVFTPTLQHYQDLLANTDFLHFFGNSVVIALGTVALSLMLGAPAAYAFARWAFRGRALLLAWILLLRMVPGMTYVVPVFVVYRSIGLLDTQLGLIVLYSVFNLALTVWSMEVFFREVPREVEEAAFVDGASIVQTFLRVVLPLSAPGLAATAILCFLFSWNEFLFALVLSRSQARTAPLAIVNFLAYEGAEWGRIGAGAVLVLLPVLLFSIAVRRYLVRGLLAGTIKG